MGKNIEIKARCHDLNKAVEALEKASIARKAILQQTDTFYNTPKGRLKLRELGTGESFLIPYLRDDEKGPKESQYALLSVAKDELERVKELLTAMYGIRGVVKKQRLLYMFDYVRIHLDDVRGLGRFIELEAVMEQETPEREAQEKVHYLMRLLNIKDSDLVAKAYIDLLETE